MTNTTACSPARATLWTSTFPTINGVNSVGQTLVMKDTLTTLGLAAEGRVEVGLGRDHTLFALTDGVVKFEGPKDKRRVSVYPPVVEAALVVAEEGELVAAAAPA